jgi:hypothetical protein
MSQRQTQSVSLRFGGNFKRHCEIGHDDRARINVFGARAADSG